MKEFTVFMDEGSIDMDIINAFEDKIGFCLPKSYKKLSSQHNQLSLVQDTFDFVNVYGEKDERDVSFFGYGNLKHEKIEDNLRISDPLYYGIPNFVAFARCANGDMICFDYRDDPKGCNPRVVLVYHDDYITQEDGTIQMVVNVVANSFEEFMDMLYEYKDE